MPINRYFKNVKLTDIVGLGPTINTPMNNTEINTTPNIPNIKIANLTTPRTSNPPQNPKQEKAVSVVYQ